MAKSMIKRRQEAERERNEAYLQTLRRVERAPREVPDLARALKDARAGFPGWAVRSGEAWQPRIKTRDPGKLLLAAARHLYGRYSVPSHLEAIWLDRRGLTDKEVSLRKRWFIAAARGDSLYRAEASGLLSRKEVHVFLTARGELRFTQAFWLAIAKSYTDDHAVAFRVATTKLGEMPHEQIAWWREVARFFCVQPTTREGMDDLIDYLAAAKRRDATFSLKGRTLATLRRLMSEWHHDTAAIERIEQLRRRAARKAGLAPENPHWEGAALADWECKVPSVYKSEKAARFVVRQLCSAEDLVYESRAMHHCVSTYAESCIEGRASIWVLRRVCSRRIDRLLTIQLDQTHRVVQIRGLANRNPTADEMQIIERWAQERKLELRHEWFHVN